MEVEKLLKLGVEYLSEYLRVLIATLRSPKLEFEPLRLRVKSRLIAEGREAGDDGSRLNPKLMGFLLVSIFIASILNANVPGRAPAPELMITTVIVVAYWMLLGSLIHVIRGLFTGREPFTRTLSLNLQVLAVIHVMSSLAAFLWGAVTTALGTGEAMAALQNLIGETATRKPVYAYFAVQFLLALIYLPLANRRGHRFGFSRLQGAVSSRALSAALMRAQAALFYAVFFALSLMVVEVSMLNYQANNVLLSQPERGVIARLWEWQEGWWDDPRRLVQMKLDVESLRRQNEALRRDVERLRSDPRTREKSARERLNMARPGEAVVPLD
ncbi:MAG TPA: septum formation initiator family protein [Pyrinomonadaceae bacterium]|jgi:cell division protein FtsB